MIAIIERLAKLEADTASLFRKQVDARDERAQIAAKLDILILRFTRYEAKWGGIMMVVSALLALSIALKNEILRLFRGLQ
jgi:hypothetical protein